MKWLTLSLLFVSLTVFCQERVLLQGKITSGEYIVPGVFIINKVTGAEVKADTTGLFSISAKAGDQLVVYSDKIEVREFAVTHFSFKEVPYIMEVKPKSTELKEVVINKGITSESLHIVPKGQKQYTPAGRRHKTATDLNMTLGLGLMPGISFSLDPIMNALSGRTKMLKKALATESKEFAVEKINGVYTEEQIMTELKIPAEYVNGFLFYAVEDVNCAAALKGKNNELAKLQMMVLAEKYIKLIESK